MCSSGCNLGQRSVLDVVTKYIDGICGPGATVVAVRVCHDALAVLNKRRDGRAADVGQPTGQHPAGGARRVGVTVDNCSAVGPEANATRTADVRRRCFGR
jgi:hypothetical protein